MVESTPELQIFIATGSQSEHTKVFLLTGTGQLISLLESYGSNRVKILHPVLGPDLSRDEVRAALLKADLVAADVTAVDKIRDRQIRLALKRGIPVVVFYKEGQEPQLAKDLQSKEGVHKYEYGLYTLDTTFREALCNLSGVLSPFTFPLLPT